MLTHFKSVSLRDMHKMQVESLMELVGFTLQISAQSNDPVLVQKAEDICDEMVRLFGGVGVSVKIVPEGDL